MRTFYILNPILMPFYSSLIQQKKGRSTKKKLINKTSSLLLHGNINSAVTDSVSYKLLVVGDSSVGKTSLLKRFIVRGLLAFCQSFIESL